MDSPIRAFLQKANGRKYKDLQSPPFGDTEVVCGILDTTTRGRGTEPPPSTTPPARQTTFPLTMSKKPTPKPKPKTPKPIKERPIKLPKGNKIPPGIKRVYGF